MSDRLRVTILGCGSSGGVPRIGGIWGDCDPSEPRNRRRRCSILVERIGRGGVTSVLVDTSPDLREQLRFVLRLNLSDNRQRSVKSQIVDRNRREARTEDHIVRQLIDYDDVSYDQHADLLYDLAGLTSR